MLINELRSVTTGFMLTQLLSVQYAAFVLHFNFCYNEIYLHLCRKLNSSFKMHLLKTASEGYISFLAKKKRGTFSFLQKNLELRMFIK